MKTRWLVVAVAIGLASGRCYAQQPPGAPVPIPTSVPAQENGSGITQTGRFTPVDGTNANPWYDRNRGPAVLPYDAGRQLVPDGIPGEPPPGPLPLAPSSCICPPSPACPCGLGAPTCYVPQMIGGDPGAVVSRVVADNLTLAQQNINFTPPAGVRLIGNVIRAPLGGSLVIQDQNIFLTSRRGAVSVITLPTDLRPLPIAGNATLFRAIPTPVERGSFKIGENDSARPMDRAFISYNWFDDVNKQDIRINRETVGFEKTFCDGLGSFEMRVPAYQLDGASPSRSGYGDLTGVIKIAPIQTDFGTVVSVGAAVTAPTGDRFIAYDGTRAQGLLLQPFLGYIFVNGPWYLQGFSSIAFGTDSRDVSEAFNDVAVGLYVYEDPCKAYIQYVVSTLELHVTTPLDHRNFNAPVYALDEISLMGGLHLGLGPNCVLTAGVGAPFTGPRPYDVELVGQLNYRF